MRDPLRYKICAVPLQLHGWIGLRLRDAVRSCDAVLHFVLTDLVSMRDFGKVELSCWLQSTLAKIYTWSPPKKYIS